LLVQRLDAALQDFVLSAGPQGTPSQWWAPGACEMHASSCTRAEHECCRSRCQARHQMVAAPPAATATKLYLHYEGYPSYTLIVHGTSEDQRTAGDLRRHFVAAYSAHYGAGRALDAGRLRVLSDKRRSVDAAARICTAFKAGSDVFLDAEPAAAPAQQDRLRGPEGGPCLQASRQCGAGAAASDAGGRDSQRSPGQPGPGGPPGTSGRSQRQPALPGGAEASARPAGNGAGREQHSPLVRPFMARAKDCEARKHLRDAVTIYTEARRADEPGTGLGLLPAAPALLCQRRLRVGRGLHCAGALLQAGHGALQPASSQGSRFQDDRCCVQLATAGRYLGPLRGSARRPAAAASTPRRARAGAQGGAAPQGGAGAPGAPVAARGPAGAGAGGRRARRGGARRRLCRARAARRRPGVRAPRRARRSPAAGLCEGAGCPAAPDTAALRAASGPCRRRGRAGCAQEATRAWPGVRCMNARMRGRSHGRAASLARGAPGSGAQAARCALYKGKMR